ncbi:hypothetical protein AC31_4858 [Escherichia coli 3-073-06_S3_C2]|nr:hypothetical protein AD45_4732 [Escherichia coli 4-203-08_S4_C3]KDZ59173.1 hypothetical protein AC31_4858 [Escherichia coli 3-073-06_S3_C2]KEL05480.1 hypothetical protein AD19_4790 [Escherichia coli 4-203-08_S4_C2]
MTVKFLTWMSPWTVLKELRWSFMRQQPEGASGKSSWK